MEVKKFWLVLVIFFLIIGLIGGFLYYYYSYCPKVILNLPRPPVDGETTWAFLVNGRERNPGDVIHVLKPFRPLKIDVVELKKGEGVPIDSGKIIDSFEMDDVIQNWDLLAYKYFSEESSGKEGLAIVAYHENGVSTLVFVDLQREEKPYITFPNLGVIVDSSGGIIDRWTILVNGKEIDNRFYPYHQGDKIIISIKENESGKIVDEIDVTDDVEKYAEIYWRYNRPSGLLNEEELSIFLQTPSDESFVYDLQEIKVKISSSLTV